MATAFRMHFSISCTLVHIGHHHQQLSMLQAGRTDSQPAIPEIVKLLISIKALEWYAPIQPVLSSQQQQQHESS